MQNLAAHIMDIAQNAVRAKATAITINVEENSEQATFSFTIEDNGCGMDANVLQRITDPFFTSRTVRKVGLGIPLLKQNAEQTGGYIDLQSQLGKGSTVKAVFHRNHWDCPPVGDIGDVVVLLITANADIEFIYTHTTSRGKYSICTSEIKATLEEVPLHHPDIVLALQEMVRENINQIKHKQ